MTLLANLARRSRREISDFLRSNALGADRTRLRFLR